MRVSNVFSPFMYKKEKLNVIVRDFKENDAKGIIELIKANYGDTYYRKDFYNPDTWVRAYKEKKIIPIIAEYENRVVGQFSLIINDKYNGEIGIEWFIRITKAGV